MSNLLHWNPYQDEDGEKKRMYYVSAQELDRLASVQDDVLFVGVLVGELNSSLE